MSRPLEPSRPRDMREFKDDLKATLAARRELSPEMEDSLVTNFLQQVERAIDARVDARVAEATRSRGIRQRNQTGTVAASLALSIPLLAIAGGIAGATGMILVLVMIVVINLIAFVRS